MTLNKIELKTKIIASLTTVNAANILELFTYTPYSKPGYRILSESLEIKNLELRSFINGLAPVPFPVFPLEASESETQLGILKLEWQGARIQSNLWIKNDSTDWIRIGMISLLNPSPAPYREFPLGDFQLGDNAMLGLQIQDVGYGLLQGNDRVNITADLIRTIALEKISEGINRDANINSDTSTLVMQSNAQRSGFTVYNPGTTDVFLDIASNVSPESFLATIKPQGFYESNFAITDAIYLISQSGNVSVKVREFQ
ncbi:MULTISPECIES: hypothetical protein [unclassified Nodularia (in: cyanobacteria)]|uniref:hypothetical protein n=1 Tax=unclassified Nodularia (in: cyanobacteria) TaxID=2656917 RepID=UPI001882531D|nr:MULTISPECIES: hypothetical protein [unclassified Nodularia (in: cyanobacteria)]MBE9199086.1 hypothetical protein [Nodularia sp. LEGE 06071]MCC2695773.1 hypothetical protein [Nodularia sp. LEGE 04288]